MISTSYWSTRWLAKLMIVLARPPCPVTLVIKMHTRGLGGGGRRRSCRAGVPAVRNRDGERRRRAALVERRIRPMADSRRAPRLLSLRPSSAGALSTGWVASARPSSCATRCSACSARTVSSRTRRRRSATSGIATSSISSLVTSSGLRLPAVGSPYSSSRSPTTSYPATRIASTVWPDAFAQPGGRVGGQADLAAPVGDQQLVADIAPQPAILLGPHGGVGVHRVTEQRTHALEQSCGLRAEGLVAFGSAGVVPVRVDADESGDAPPQQVRLRRPVAHRYDVHTLRREPACPAVEYQRRVEVAPRPLLGAVVHQRGELLDGVGPAELERLLPRRGKLLGERPGGEHKVHLGGLQRLERSCCLRPGGPREPLVRDHDRARPFPGLGEHLLPRRHGPPFVCGQRRHGPDRGRRTIVVEQTATRDQHTVLGESLPVSPKCRLQERRTRLWGTDVQEDPISHAPLPTVRRVDATGSPGQPRGPPDRSVILHRTCSPPTAYFLHEAANRRSDSCRQRSTTFDCSAQPADALQVMVTLIQHRGQRLHRSLRNGALVDAGAVLARGGFRGEKVVEVADNGVAGRL